MQNMNLVNWFEIPVTDMDRAKTFYENVFGIEISINEMGDSVMGWFPFNEDAPGASGSLVKHSTSEPSHSGTLVYFSVDDIDNTLAKAGQNGGRVLSPKMSIGEHGYWGAFEDSEGNKIALHSQ